MNEQLQSLKPIPGVQRPLRQRISWRGELALALLPTIVILAVLGFVEVLTEQRLLFASLASSAFLIYLDPGHGTNSVRTLVISHLLAAGLGYAAYIAIGSQYLSAGAAMVATIVLMILLDAVHPPAVATSLGFALRAENQSNLVLFALAVGVMAVLVVLQRAAVWLLAHYGPHRYTHRQ